ncbi:UNVERIFIED_CONTAM: hypothetical protein HDU68_012313 [Siphonaria sp. JEL0065]|nr:hypothetical protein HDU68_012313 [Siphonaria sp. JEL0065]
MSELSVVHNTNIAAASLALQSGDTLKAVALFSKAIKASPSSAVLDVRAQLLVKLGRTDEALNDAMEMVKLDPKKAVVTLSFLLVFRAIPYTPLPKGYLRAASIFNKKKMIEPAFKICKIGVAKIDAGDEDRKALETLYIALAGKLGITLKRQKKENVSPPASKKSKIQELESNTIAISVPIAPSDSSDGLIVAPLPPPLPSFIHNFGTHSIPFEIIQEIFKYIPLKEITKCLRVSTQIRAMLSNNKFLWRDIDVSKHSHKVTDATIASLMLRGRDQVHSIILKDCSKLTKTGLKSIQLSKSKLSCFELTFNRKAIPEAIVVAIRASSGESIKRINLSGTSLTDEAFGLLLEKCRVLEELVVSECVNLTDNAMNTAIKTVMVQKQQQQDQKEALPPVFSLKLLDVSGNTKLSDKLVSNVARCFPLLESINLAKLEITTNRSLEAIALYCKNLTSLDATGVTFSYIPGGNTLNNTLLLIAKECANLKSIRIAACKFLEDNAVNALTALCPNLEVIGIDLFLKAQSELNYLEVLDVNSISTITDKSMELLSVYGKRKLKELNVSGCGITGAGVLVFAKAKREAMDDVDSGKEVLGLEVWNMDRCSGVANATIVAVRHMFPQCRVTANLQ